MGRSSVVRRGTAAFVALLVMVGMAGPQVAAADASIDIYGSNITFLNSFTKLSCKVVPGKHGHRFVLVSKDNGWRLDVVLNKFGGFHNYNIKYGTLENQVDVKTSSGVNYLTAFGPDGQDGGYVKFGKDKKGKPDKTKIEVSTVAYAQSGFTLAVLGTGKCTYGKKK